MPPQVQIRFNAETVAATNMESPPTERAKARPEPSVDAIKVQGLGFEYPKASGIYMGYIWDRLSNPRHQVLGWDVLGTLSNSHVETCPPV